MQLVGNIEEVVFRNNENGYTIVKLMTSDGEITATGKFPIVGDGEQVVLDGDFILHSKYGMQFKADFVKVYQPTEKEQIIKYLSCGLISGVGPVTANAIVDMFGSESLEIIEKDPMALAKVRGVSEKKAAAIAAIYNDIRRMQDAVIFLQKYDITINMAVKIYDKYKDKTEKILSVNPYKLVEDISGIGFKTADKIAEKMGIDKDSTFRLRAAVVFELSETAELAGSTMVLQEDLFNKTCELLEFNKDQKRDAFEQVVAELIIDGILKEIVEDNKEVFLCLARYFKMEQQIATKLVMLSYAKFDIEKNIDLKIAEYEKRVGFCLHDMQKKAIRYGVNGGVVLITGGPGTGKTTIINAINSILHSMQLSTILLAPTGRAAKKLSESTGEEAKTIHRAIDLNFKGAGFEKAFFTSQDIGKDAVIVDEASMIDDYVMSSLLNSIKVGSRLVIVGDKDQLPSVGAGNVLDDIIKSEIVPVISLSQIFRQAEESMIVSAAHKINSGELPDLSSKNKDFFFTQKLDPAMALDEVIELVSTRLPKYLNVGEDKIQVICPTKVGAVGATNINQKLQDRLNPKDDSKVEVTFGSKLFRTGDRVMQIVNNYDQEWSRGAELGAGVFNGDMGLIEDINPLTHETIVNFEDGRRAFYSIAELDDLVLSYAITIHKSQGSEFDAVVIPILGGNPILFNRNLLYTAVTRAKKLVMIVGNRNSIYSMVKNERSIKRLTQLKSLIENEQKKYNDLFKINN